MGSLTTASRRVLVRALGAFLPLALGAAALSVPSTGQVTAAPSLAPVAAAPASPTYRPFTLNILHDLGVDAARQDMEKAFTLGDVGGLQEMSDAEDRQTLRDLATQRNWGWYMPEGAGIAIPIIWNRARFLLIEGRSVMVHGPEEGVTPARFINVVKLREVATGKVFGFINTHTIAQASRDAQLSDMHRIPRLRLHLQMLRAEIVALFASTEHVFAGGDLNVNYLADRNRRNPSLPTDALADLVNFDIPLTGTRGPTSLLDYGMSVKDNSGLQLTSSTVVRGFNSDHDAVVFTYQPVDLFATGALLNEPTGTTADRGRVISRQIRAVLDTEPGAQIRIAASKLDDAPFVQALQAAHARGVAVQVVAAAGAVGPVIDSLSTTLGADTTQPSWFRRCVDTCLGGVGRSEADFMLVSRAGGTTELTMVGGSAPINAARGLRTSMYQSSDPGLHAAYGLVFSRMAADTTDASSRVINLGPTQRVFLYPAPEQVWKDPVVRALKPVKCRKARGLRTDDGRTDVRVVVRSWSGERGLFLVKKLAALRAEGCDVAVVAGGKVRKNVRGDLKKAGIPTRFAEVGQNLLVVDGRYGRKGRSHWAFTGGPSWTGKALGGDATMLALFDATTVGTYLDAFSQAWKAGTRS